MVEEIVYELGENEPAQRGSNTAGGRKGNVLRGIALRGKSMGLLLRPTWQR